MTQINATLSLDSTDNQNELQRINDLEELSEQIETIWVALDEMGYSVNISSSGGDVIIDIS
jgi:hypothetical protein